MTYADMNAQYRDGSNRGRYDMAIKEQANLTFANDADPANKALANGVIGGEMKDVDALITSIIVGPNGATLDDDANLLAAVQAAWPTVAGARYGAPA